MSPREPPRAPPAPLTRAPLTPAPLTRAPLTPAPPALHARQALHRSLFWGVAASLAAGAGAGCVPTSSAGSDFSFLKPVTVENREAGPVRVGEPDEELEASVCESICNYGKGSAERLKLRCYAGHIEGKSGVATEVVVCNGTNPPSYGVKPMLDPFPKFYIRQGRWTEGAPPAPSAAEEPVRSLAELFTTMAHFEGVAELAFERLARELEAHGAPFALVDEARRAARDERRHTRVAKGLARAHGARASGRATAALPSTSSTPPAASTRSAASSTSSPVRAPLEVALENAREGCVFEAFSALVTCLQALRADDPDVRRALRVIADDEVRHAALSREIDAFYRATLGDDGRAALDDEHRRATLELAAAPDPVDPEVARRAGLPRAHERRALLRALAAVGPTAALT